MITFDNGICGGNRPGLASSDTAEENTENEYGDGYAAKIHILSSVPATLPTGFFRPS